MRSESKPEDPARRSVRYLGFRVYRHCIVFMSGVLGGFSAFWAGFAFCFWAGFRRVLLLLFVAGFPVAYQPCFDLGLRIVGFTLLKAFDR